jgi:putative transposase
MEREQSARQQYPSDLTDVEWSLIKDDVRGPVWFPPLQKPVHTARELLNAIRYRTRTGVAWRSLPREFGPWSSVFKWYQKWNEDGTIDALHDKLRRMVRVAEGREPEPTAAILDSQSIKSTDVGGPRGFDAGKKGKGAQAPRGGRRAGVDSRAHDHAGICPGS